MRPPVDPVPPTRCAACAVALAVALVVGGCRTVADPPPDPAP
ncbi:hypothetical protein [Prescottella sp. R16]|nr:hypothetical protein [Prescottella sp. R16]